MMDEQSILAFDTQHIWHPYSSVSSDMPLYAVERADGVIITMQCRPPRRHAINQTDDHLLRLLSRPSARSTA